MTNKNNSNTGLPFIKMHGLGNDFVIIDAREAANPVSQALARAVGDRHFGVGFDQLAVLTKSETADVDVAFWNSDGSTAGACGNASRCIAQMIMQETGETALTLRTVQGLLPAVAKDGLISVNMGQPVLDWQKIPLAENVDLNALPIDGSPGAAGMGNPHCVFVVEDVEAINVAETGAKIERHPLYPERTNVEFIQVISPTELRMRVWERGGMITLACGSGACAAAVVAHRKGLTERAVTVHLDGGSLDIDWRDDGVWMTGPAQKVFEGHLSPEFLETV